MLSDRAIDLHAVVGVVGLTGEEGGGEGDIEVTKSTTMTRTTGTSLLDEREEEEGRGVVEVVMAEGVGRLRTMTKTFLREALEVVAVGVGEEKERNEEMAATAMAVGGDTTHMRTVMTIDLLPHLLLAGDVRLRLAMIAMIRTKEIEEEEEVQVVEEDLL